MKATRLFDFLEMQIYKHPDNRMLSSKQQRANNHKDWKHYTFMEVQRIVNRVCTLLINLGLKQGDNIAIVSGNRPEWNFVDLAALQLGIVSVPIYQNISEKDYEYIFKDAEIKYAFVEGETIQDIVLNISGNLPHLKSLFNFDNLEPSNYFWDFLPSQIDIHQIQRRKDRVKENDVATIIYTSGTTGNPKGVMLTHKNIVSNVNSIRQVTPFKDSEIAVSFLPLCHSFERMTFFTYLSYGFHIYYPESMETLGETLLDVKPFCFTTVPRMLEKVYESIMKKSAGLTGIKKIVFSWAIETAMQYRLGESNGIWFDFKLRIARKLVFEKWQKGLGGNIHFIITGAAAVQSRLITLFTAAGIHVIEGYGLTETSPVLCSNRIDEQERCIGTVGYPIPGIEIELAYDGEILAKGPNIMKGYYKLPQLTREVIDEKGWFHTGDIGEWVMHHGKRFLKITDRKKELFKTAGGKYIAPQVIENKMKESPYIDQIMVVGGDDKKYISALIVPSFPELINYAKLINRSCTNRNELIQMQTIIDLFEKEINNYNGYFGKWERIKKFRLLTDEWTPQTGELTPTLKLKRKFIAEKYKTEIVLIYKEDEEFPSYNPSIIEFPA